MGLRHVEHFDLLAVRHAGAFEVHRLQKAVHLPGADALAPLRGHQFQRASPEISVHGALALHKWRGLRAAVRPCVPDQPGPTY